MEFVVTEDGLLLKFEYERDLVNKIKKIQGRRFDTIQQGWVIPYYSIEWLKNIIEIPDDINTQMIERINDKKTFLNDLDLRTPLKPFQIDALNFMIEKQKSMLCADMGLGKTCMSIAYSKYLLDRGLIKKVVIFCPKTLKRHWLDEIDKFIYADSVIIENYKPNRKKSWEKSFESQFIILNYEQIFNVQTYLNLKNIFRDDTLIILDEATRIKNIKAQTSKRIKTFKSKYKVILTGRPVENRPEELYSINGFLENNILGSWDYFKNNYIRYDNFGRVLKYINLSDLGNKIRQIMFRCKKDDVLDDLPEKIINTYDIELSRSEIINYRRIENLIKKEIKSYKTGKTTFKNVLSVMQISKMFCDHPDLVKNSESETAKSVKIDTDKHSKFDELLEVIKEIDSKIVIFSQYTKMCHIINDELKKLGYTTVMITGEDTDRDAKINEFKEKAQILVCSDVMSYGVNLQVASVIINYDLQWNPAKNEQRIARLHRMGQKNVVNVINLVIADEDKIEQQIRKILKLKDDNFEEIMN